MKLRSFGWHTGTKPRRAGKPNIHMSSAAESYTGYSVCQLRLVPFSAMTIRYLCSIALHADMPYRWCRSGHHGLFGSSINEERSDLCSDWDELPRGGER